MADNLSPYGYTVRAVQNAERTLMSRASEDIAQMMGVNEGIKKDVYTDTKGNKSIAIGFNLEDETNQPILDELGLDRDELKSGKRSLNDKEISAMYNYSFKRAANDLKKFDPDINTRPYSVQKALLDMSYNLGYTKLSKFVKMKEALQNNDYEKAADEMVDSLWYKQVGDRGPRTEKLMRGASDFK